MIFFCFYVRTVDLKEVTNAMEVIPTILAPSKDATLSSYTLEAIRGGPMCVQKLEIIISLSSAVFELEMRDIDSVVHNTVVLLIHLNIKNP